MTIEFTGHARIPGMSESSSQLEAARRYLKAIESRTLGDVVDLFAPDMVMEQFPNRIYPNGLRAGLAEMLLASEKGRKLLSSESYQITNELVTSDRVALEVLWTGRLAVSFGTLKEGSEMRAHFAMFLEFREGKIAAQRNYDCFDPW
jgi:ketosteroid isomerase-like protein